MQLRADDLVTTGVTTDVFEAKQGDEIEAVFDGVGWVSVRFD
jgi:2-keto-4-pentenoate hydratase